MTRLELHTTSEKIKAAIEFYEIKQFTDAFALFHELAEEGEPSVFTRVCYMYMKGEGVPLNIDKAIYWCKKSAENSSEGLFYLGKAYVRKNQWDETIRCFEKAAEQEYSPAIYCLARIYLTGVNVVKNKKLSLMLMEKASHLGHILGRRDYSVMLILGQKGILEIPRGLFLFLTWPIFTFKTVKNDQGTEKELY